MNALILMLRQFTIRTRMFGALAMVLGLFAVMGAVGLAGGWKLRQINQEFGDQAIRKTEIVGAMRSHLAKVRVIEKQMVLDYETGSAVAQSRQDWQAALAATKKDLGTLLEGPEDADNAPARAAIESLDRYAANCQSVLHNIETTNYDNARAADRMLAKAKADMVQAEASIDKVAEAVQAETESRRLQFGQVLGVGLWAFGGIVAVGMVIVAPLTIANLYSITGPIGAAARSAQAIAAGDLSQPIHSEGRDEASQLQRALAQMQQRLQELIGQVRTASEQIRTSSAEVASGNSDLSRRTEQAAGSLQQTSTAMEELTAAVRQTADASGQARGLAGQATQFAQYGGDIVAEVVATMEEINTRSHRIGAIIGTIDGIAFQTNILALNAAVEAARAGEQGRGFAVVASEVRSLAHRSAEAAREIKGLIGASVERVEAGVLQVNQAGSTMKDIVASVDRVSGIIGEISVAANEQSSGIGQVNGSVTDLDHMTQQNASLVEQSAAAAESLHHQAEHLSGLVAGFKL
jgi:methyl-accepting chemotaxis protein